MSLVLVASGAALGAAASPHCLTMCGAPCAALTHRCRRDLAGFHAGRAIGYMAGGALAAASIGTLSALNETVPFVRPFWILVQLGFLALGLAWLWTGRPVRHFALPAPSGTRVDVIRFRTRRATLAGLGWVAWPCGALQGALLLAGMASSAVEGALVMGAYAAGSLPALALTTVAIRSAGGTRRWWHRLLDPSNGLRIAGLCLVTTSGVALLHGMWARIAAFCGA